MNRISIKGVLIGGVVDVVTSTIFAFVYAKHDELLNGVASSFLCVALGMLTIFTGNDPHSLLVKLLLLIASPVCGLLGGYLALLRRRAITERQLAA
jgi:hypothetical protein